MREGFWKRLLTLGQDFASQLSNIFVALLAGRPLGLHTRGNFSQAESLLVRLDIDDVGVGRARASKSIFSQEPIYLFEKRFTWIKME